MKTITFEIKKRIFAQYFGADYYYKNEFVTFREKVEFGYHINRIIESQTSFLYLTPLSKITDEDAIEIIQMQVAEKYKELEIKSKQNEDLWYLCQPNRGGKMNCILDYGNLNFKTYQFLSSKGYALPYMDYSVDELVELGVYKLK